VCGEKYLIVNTVLIKTKRKIEIAECTCCVNLRQFRYQVLICYNMQQINSMVPLLEFDVFNEQKIE